MEAAREEDKKNDRKKERIVRGTCTSFVQLYADNPLPFP